MATYTITLNERSARGKALIEYLKALGVLMHKVSPKSATKHRLYDPETGEYLNDETHSHWDRFCLNLQIKEKKNRTY